MSFTTWKNSSENVRVFAASLRRLRATIRTPLLPLTEGPLLSYLITLNGIIATSFSILSAKLFSSNRDTWLSSIHCWSSSSTLGSIGLPKQTQSTRFFPPMASGRDGSGSQGFRCVDGLELGGEHHLTPELRRLEELGYICNWDSHLFWTQFNCHSFLKYGIAFCGWVFESREVRRRVSMLLLVN